MQHRVVNARINNYSNASTSCEILVKIGAVTSEFKSAKIENLSLTRLQFDDNRSLGTLAL